MKTIIELANELADLRVMAARGQCVTSDEVADAYKALEAAIAAARCQALEEAAKVCESEAWRLKSIAVSQQSAATNSKSIGLSVAADKIRALIGAKHD